MVSKLIHHLKDYCSNCTLSPLGYIANPNLHFTERIFWLICVILSAIGSYLLISQFQQDYDSKAVSIVYESIQPHEKIVFPPISVCEIYDKNDFPENVEEYVKSLADKDAKYNFDVETHVFFLMYPYLYHENTGKARCSPYENCDGCIKCPADGYRQVLMKLTTDCPEYFVNCSLSGRPFDCCQYFVPLITPYGNCFLVNSLLNNEPGSEHWLNTIIDPLVDTAIMTLVTTKPMQVTIQNAEDIPNNVVPGVSITILDAGQQKSIQVYIENIVNDHDVRDVAPKFRNCRFPDEILPHSVYKAYSFSTCIADCVRMHQMRICNCTLCIMLPEPHESIRDCGLEGYLCLETFAMIKPDSKMLLPWANNNFTCECLPSCTEHDLRSIYETKSDLKNDNHRYATIRMPVLPTERYRRQALRTRLDVVVTIGGILGLFMGASILSGIEILYYFTLRLYTSLKHA